MIGFVGHTTAPRVDNLTIKADRDADGTYETTEHVEGFDVDLNGYAQGSFTHDAAGKPGLRQGLPLRLRRLEPTGAHHQVNSHFGLVLLRFA